MTRLHTLSLIGLMVSLSPSIVSAQSNLGRNGIPVSLVKVRVVDGEAYEEKSTLSIRKNAANPHLVLYVPATVEARDCVYSIVNPLKEASKTIRPLHVTNILDVSQRGILLSWIVTRYYKSDVIEAANERAHFFIDYDGNARRMWTLPGDECAYTLYDPPHKIISGSGTPTRHFVKRILEQLRTGVAAN